MVQRVRLLVKALNGAKRTNEALARCRDADAMVEVLLDASSRLGLGLTGLADALIMLGARYDDEVAYRLAADTMRVICHSAYRASAELAQEKGPFPCFDPEAYPAAPFVRALPEDIRQAIRSKGMRNSHLTAIAPTGTISLLADNVSSGIEPVFDFSYSRRVLTMDGRYAEHQLS